MTIEALANASSVGETTIKDIRDGRTPSPRKETLEKLSSALGVTYESLLSDPNPHIYDGTNRSYTSEYGPSASSALRFGNFRTLYLCYDVLESSAYDPENLLIRIARGKIPVSDKFEAVRKAMASENKKRRKKGDGKKTWWDGPALALKSFQIEMTEDGVEEKNIKLNVVKSSYSYSVAAKSDGLSLLRKSALKRFHFLDQPIPWLTFGLGVSGVVFINGGSHFLACKRSQLETHRSGEYDVSFAEGILAAKDCTDKNKNLLSPYKTATRAVKEELGITPRERDIQIFSFGCDLEYYQWGYMADITTDLSFDEAHLCWQSSKDRFETSELFQVEATPEAAASYISQNPIWSFGVANLYYCLRRRSDDPRHVDRVFIEALRSNSCE